MIGIQICGGFSASNGNSKRAGITPTITIGSPSTTAGRPTIEGSREKRCAHSVSEITAVRVAPRASSAGVRTRP